MTFPSEANRWHGYFSFRPSHSEVEADEVRTTDIFLEASETAIHDKARSLGRPLLRGLLDSALHTAARVPGDEPHLRGRFRTLLAESSSELAGADGVGVAASVDRTPDLRSLYESYRLDQVCHFICLVDPDDFDGAVDRILDGASIDFRSRDRVQFARMVVDYIEERLPLPDFESWVADYTARPDTYRLYAHTLHRGGRLP